MSPTVISPLTRLLLLNKNPMKKEQIIALINAIANTIIAITAVLTFIYVLPAAL